MDGFAKYFTDDYHGAPFMLFGRPHTAALLVLLALNLGMLPFRNAPETVRRRLRIGLAIVIWVDESLWHAWNLYYGHWSATFMLPLHLCSALIWLSGVALITKNEVLYEFIYLLGIGAAFQYLLTPDLGAYGFPHFRFFQTFISHGSLLTSGVYLTAVEGLRPRWLSLLRVAAAINIYMAVIYPLNILLGSNYLLINAKPATPSVLDLLPAWPVYIPYMEGIGILTCLLLYLPFALKDRAARAGQSVE